MRFGFSNQHNEITEIVVNSDGSIDLLVPDDWYNAHLEAGHARDLALAIMAESRTEEEKRNAH